LLVPLEEAIPICLLACQLHGLSWHRIPRYSSQVDNWWRRWWFEGNGLLQIVRHLGRYDNVRAYKRCSGS
jgi:hypothetical protein